MRKKSTKHIIAAWAGATIFLFASALPVAADVTDPLVFIPQVGVPGLVEKGQQITLANNDTSYIALMIKSFYNYGLGIAGILAAIVLMAGGILWLASAGSSDKISQAKELIIGSITGLLLVFSSWIILKTVNPYLLEMKISQIKTIERISFCCHPEKGNVLMIINKNGKASCPDTQSTQCQNNTTCENTGVGDINTFSCVDKKNSYCCEYEGSLHAKYCKPISITAAVKGGRDCAMDNPDMNKWKWVKTENEYCKEGARYTNDSDFSCTKNICENVENSDKCKNVSLDTVCYCYNEQPWFREGKEGEPCGNEEGSACTSKGTGGAINPTCTQKGWFHDFHYNSRGCGTDLYCCYPD